MSDNKIPEAPVPDVCHPSNAVQREAFRTLSLTLSLSLVDECRTNVRRLSGARKDAGAEAGVGAYNGDLGIITAVDVDARSVTVQMDDKKYTYTADQLNELEPAYAVTVHKSQGSEFPAVILPVADVPARLCYRNLLYTGVTRARKLCVLTGTARTEQTMVENVRQNMRYSGLRYLLKDAATPTEEKQEQLSAT